MTLTKIGSILAVLTAIVGTAFTIDNRYAHAEETKQQQAKSVNELRAEFYLARIKAINDKPKPTKDEQDEKERLLALVKAIEAEKVKK